MKIMIFDEPQVHSGFNFQEGFAALLNSSGIPVAATSGRERKGNLLYVYRYVYRPAEDGRWDGRWESEETFPVQLVLDAIQDWRKEQKMKIHVFSEPQSSCGFNFKEGFVALLNNSGTPVAATSGWECEGMLYVYRPAQDGSWAGSWEGPETFPVEDVLDAIQDWKDSAELSKALSFAEGKKLHLSNEDIVFTDVVPGEKHHDGGEYGFYTRYSPMPEYPGIYRVSTETSCEFDACGTGPQGIRALTVREYRRLKKASDKVKEIKKQVDLYEEWNPICCQNGNPGIGWFSGDHPQCCGNCKGFIII